MPFVFLSLLYTHTHTQVLYSIQVTLTDTESALPWRNSWSLIIARCL